MPPKTSCPVSLTQFLEKAEPLKVVINGQEMLAEGKQFSTGSFGWYMNGKTVVSIDGKAVSVCEFPVHRQPFPVRRQCRTHGNASQPHTDVGTEPGPRCDGLQ